MFRRVKFSYIACFIFFFIIIIAYSPPITKGDEISELVEEYQILREKQIRIGEDVKKADELDQLSRISFADGNPEEAKILLRKAIAILKGSKTDISEKDQLRGVSQSQTVMEEENGRYNSANIKFSNFESPFGIFGPYEYLLDSKDISIREVNSYLLDLGVTWVQEMPFNVKYIPRNINICSRLGREGGVRPPYIKIEHYKNALRQFIRKNKKRIVYYEIDTEPSGLKPPIGWRGYPKEYSNFLIETYKIVKSECPKCQVVIGGIPGVGTTIKDDSYHIMFLKDVLDSGASKYFDVFHFKQHHHKSDDYLEIGRKYKLFGKILKNYGIDIDKVTVFLETACYDGNPNYPRGHHLSFLPLPPETEAKQAATLVKTYVYSLAVGIDKIFWNGIIERYNFGGSKGNPFNFYGLINNPKNDGHSHKKLSYYTFKEMVGILNGSDWNKIDPIKEKDGVFIYKFYKDDKNIWVAWNDTHKAKKIIIKGIHSSKVKITYSVPKQKSGKSIKHSKDIFKKFMIESHYGEIEIDLSEIPIFIEEL